MAMALNMVRRRCHGIIRQHDNEESYVVAGRSLIDVILRTLFATGAAIAGSTLVVASAADNYAASDVEAPAWLLPANGRLLAGRARQRLQEAPESTDAQHDALSLAKVALLREPTAVSAVATLGLLAELGGDLPAARRRFGYAERLSRRDLPTELWLIEDAVRREDISGALQHYDVALRTQAGSSDILFPVLAKASVDSSVASALGRKLMSRPPWGDMFLVFLANGTADPVATMRFYVDLSRRHLVIPQTARSALVSRLIDSRKVHDAWAYYVTFHPGADPRRSRDPRFTASIETPTAFDWTTSNDPGVTANIQRGAGSGVAAFSAAPTVGGILMQQTQLLPPGRYRIEGVSEGIDQQPDERPYWLLQCSSDGRELGRVEMPNSNEKAGRFAGELNVGADCPVQALMLVARPSTASSGLAGAISYVQLAPRN